MNHYFLHLAAHTESAKDEKSWEDKSRLARALKAQSRLSRLEKRIASYRELRTAVSDVRELAGILFL